MRALCVACLIAALLLPSLSLAQSPYSPLTPDTTTMLTTGRFERSPLRLPFPEQSVNAISRENRIDFEHIYNVPFETVLTWLRDPKNNKDGFELIDPAVYPAAAGMRFKLMSAPTNTGGGLVFEHPTLSRRVIVDITPRGAQTVVVFQNQVLTDLFSGVMPARQGFIPAGTDAIIPFRWN